MQPRDIPITVAFVGTLLVNVPQLWKTYKTKDVAAFSVSTMVLRIIINISWIIFGIIENDLLIIGMSVEVACCELLLLLFKGLFSANKTPTLNVPMEQRVGSIYHRDVGDNIQVLCASI